ncbi:facilitated trehalose transporter Tret1 isoform X2 [Eupeodes corollae]|uniref:facilitated trehalose transporter Tret1 isoform X2 n=1 Tax=Eupeodes corollae TaxID=290404 RepID=UPI00249356FA|nr:facilitated trehalose transporter Tret1 isoform X2 [Eupeodes corollae]
MTTAQKTISISTIVSEKTVSQEDADQNARNPMLYDPLSDGAVRTSTKMQYVAALVVCLGAVSAGTALAWTSPVLPQISVDPTINITANSTNSDELRLTVGEQTWVSSLLAIGAFLAALPTGYIADAIGRKYTALLMDVPFIVAWIMTIFAKSAGMLCLARFLIGISTGSFCVVAPMYISEIAETSIRGSLGTLFQLTLSCGILMVYLVGAAVSWKALSVFCLCIPIGLFIGMCFLPETPVYLLKKGRRGDAALSLKWLWGRYCDSRSAIQIIQTDLDSAGSDASFMDVFRNRAAKNALIISMLLMFFQQFSGVNAVIFYTVPIFKSAGSTLNPSACSIIVGIVQVSMTLASSFLIERAGRKILLIFSSICQLICLTVLGIYFDMKDSGKDVSEIGWLPLLSVVLFMVTFSLGYGPIPWLMMGELFPPDVKATAVALTVMSNWFSVFMVTKCFGSMVEALGSDVTFWFFAFCMFSATLYVFFMVFETKGKSSAQIQMLLGAEK